MSRFLTGIQLNDWILMTTPLFLAAFVGLLIWVYRKSGKSVYCRMAQLPFEEDGGSYVPK